MQTALIIIFFCALSFLFLAWFLGRKARKAEQGTRLSEKFKSRINESKIVKIDGTAFKIRKIKVLDYLEGAKVLAQMFSTYQTKKSGAQGAQDLDNLDIANMNKLKKYLTDVICAGCVEPRFVRSEKDLDEDSVLIDDLFSDWILAQKVAQEIFEFTYGKKKSRIPPQASQAKTSRIRYSI
jgi:hypothetical protein